MPKFKISVRNLMIEWTNMTEQSEFKTFNDILLYTCGGDYTLFDDPQLIQFYIKLETEHIKELKKLTLETTKTYQETITFLKKQS